MEEEKDAFVLSWCGIILKRILRCTFLYCEHKKIDIDSTSLLKCLKYNLFAPTGIVLQLAPYLQKAFTQGFLMPKEYGNNDCVKKAIRMFGEAYRISVITDKEVQKEEASIFLKKVVESFATEKANKKEIEDILSLPQFKTSENPHTCTFCELVDAWDIDISLCASETKYHSLLLLTLLQILKFIS